MDSLVIVDRLSRPNVYFSMYFSRNSGFSLYSGHFASGSVGESNQFGCCGFSCADLRCKFKLHLIEGE